MPSYNRHISMEAINLLRSQLFEMSIVVVRFFCSNYLQSIVYSADTSYVRELVKAFLYYSHLELF